jgi:hypothetical protein
MTSEVRRHGRGLPDLSEGVDSATLLGTIRRNIGSGDDWDEVIARPYRRFWSIDPKRNFTIEGEMIWFRLQGRKFMS